MGCPTVGGEVLGERSASCAARTPGIGAGIPLLMAMSSAPSSLLEDEELGANPALSNLAHDGRAPALFLRYPSPGGGIKCLQLPWVAGKRLQFYLKEAQLVGTRLRCRLVSRTRRCFLRMSYVPQPNEEISLTQPGMPLAHA